MEAAELTNPNTAMRHEAIPLRAAYATKGTLARLADALVRLNRLADELERTEAEALKQLDQVRRTL